MNNIPTPLTLEKLIAQGGIEGSEEAYDDEHGFDYSGLDDAFLYYGGNEFSGGTPFTGFYYELYPNGKLELYSKYQDGLPIEDYFEFYEDGKIKTSKDGSRVRLELVKKVDAEWAKNEKMPGVTSTGHPRSVPCRKPIVE